MESVAVIHLRTDAIINDARSEPADCSKKTRYQTIGATVNGKLRPGDRIIKAPRRRTGIRKHRKRPDKAKHGVN